MNRVHRPYLGSKNLRRIPLMNQLSFYIGYFWSYHMVLARFRSFLDPFRSFLDRLRSFWIVLVGSCP